MVLISKLQQMKPLAKNNLVANVQNGPLQVKINGNKQTCVSPLSVEPAHMTDD